MPSSQPTVESRWQVADPDPGAVEAIRAETDLPETVVRALVNRGIDTPQAARAFLDPTLSSLNDPFAMKDMDRAVSRVMEAIERGESICIHGDYDADGMTATALLATFFEQAGVPVRTFLPDRMTDGYGLNPERLGEIVKEGVSLILAVDCGTTAVEETASLKEMGSDLVILDHHTPGPELPDAAAVVNPHREDCPFPFKDLCAAGVAFYFAGALRSAMSTAGKVDRDLLDIRPLLDLVAVGTICDAVPLLSDNRVLVSAGLRLLTQGPRLGLVALKAVAGVGGRPVTAGVVAFQLGPRLNAIGRLGNPAAGLDLLMAHDPEAASRHADTLDGENRARRAVGDDVLKSAIEQAERDGGPSHKAIVVSGEGWHPGVVGIVASRLVERYSRPAVVIGVSESIGKGSCRSVRGFDIGGALAGMSEMFIRHGGHPMAAGLTIESGRIDDFRQAMYRLADEAIDDDTLLRTIRIDDEISLDVVDASLVETVSTMQPHGIGNPEPVFSVSGVRVVKARRVGRDRDHLQLELEAGGRTVPAIWWGGGGIEGIEPGAELDVAFNLTMDGRHAVPRLKVRDARRSRS